MTYIQSIILGIVQGLTEFLPISSSAHLVLVPFLLGWDIPDDQNFLFGVLVQMGTLVAVIAYFWKDLWEVITGFVRALIKRQPFTSPQALLGWYLILATIPAGLFGLLVKDQVEAAFNSPVFTAIFLLVTAVLLIAAELIGKRTRSGECLNWIDSLVMGLFQALSIFPGISRSGSTITGGMLRNLERPAAARFSFLMSVPVMIAAGVLATADLFERGIAGSALPVFLAGLVAAGVVGYFSIHWLLSFLGQRPLYVFSGYCAAAAAIVLFTAASQPAERSIPETGEVLRINLASELTYMEPEIRTCAVGSVLFVEPEAVPSLEDADLAISLGQPTDLPDFAAKIGEAQVDLVVNEENPVESLSPENLLAIYQGAVSDWSDLGGEAGDLSVWTFPSGHTLRAVFESQAIPSSSTTSLAYLAPSSAAMAEAVAGDPGAIGYLLEPWASGSVRTIQSEVTPLTLPILALADEEPRGALRQIVACLQEG